jgi:hypothetical protein
MIKSNETLSAAFGSRAEALAYVAGIRQLADLCPDRDIRVSGFAMDSTVSGMPWRVHVQCLVATEGPYNAGGWDE